MTDKIKEDIIKELQDYGYMKSYSDKIIKKCQEKHSHGYCCYCSDCNYEHDNCVCTHNWFVEMLNRTLSNDK